MTHVLRDDLDELQNAINAVLTEVRDGTTEQVNS